METFSMFLLFNSLPPELQQIARELAKDKSGCHYPWHTTDFLLALGSACPITSLCKLITLHTINWKVQCFAKPYLSLHILVSFMSVKFTQLSLFTVWRIQCQGHTPPPFISVQNQGKVRTNRDSLPPHDMNLHFQSLHIPLQMILAGVTINYNKWLYPTLHWVLKLLCIV
jgi:hypothetical protein